MPICVRIDSYNCSPYTATRNAKIKVKEDIESDSHRECECVRLQKLKSSRRDTRKRLIKHNNNSNNNINDNDNNSSNKKRSEEDMPVISYVIKTR